jgi:capsular polysaccharide transport system permease protein
MNRLFLLTVIAPTLLSTVYFGFIASDVYISEAKFVVRSPERHSSSPLGALLKGTGFVSSESDTDIVQEFITSRDALKALDQNSAFRQAFSREDIDIFSRFAGLTWWEKSFEELYRYYQKKVDVSNDSASSVSILTVRAYSDEDAVNINRQLLDMSEQLVNQLSERGRQDLIRFASLEVQNAEEKAKAAALVLSAYRNQKNVIDPERQSGIQLQQIAKLQDERVTITAQLAQVQAFTPDNPQIPSLKLRADRLQQEIDAEINRVAGSEKSLAKKASEFERLALEREFADKQLSIALASLEQARNEAVRKQLYLERIAQPSKPDKAMAPRRARGVLATFVMSMVAWGILTILLAGVREHKD